MSYQTDVVCSTGVK